MKTFLLGTLVGLIAGVAGIGAFHYLTSHLHAYSPDRLVNAVKSKESVVGTSAHALPPVKAMIGHSLGKDGTDFRRHLLANSNYVVLETTEKEIIIEMEIWDQKTWSSIYYDSDPVALKRYLEKNRKNRISWTKESLILEEFKEGTQPPEEPNS